MPGSLCWGQARESLSWQPAGSVAMSDLGHQGRGQTAQDPDFNGPVNISPRRPETLRHGVWGIQDHEVQRLPPTKHMT